MRLVGNVLAVTRPLLKNSAMQIHALRACTRDSRVRDEITIWTLARDNALISDEIIARRGNCARARPNDARRLRAPFVQEIRFYERAREFPLCAPVFFLSLNVPRTPARSTKSKASRQKWRKERSNRQSFRGRNGFRYAR